MFPDGQGGVLDESFGLRCWHGVPEAMRAAHRHDDVEVNVVTAGEITYLFGGTVLTVAAGSTAAFWATMPHQLVHAAPGSRSLWLTLPVPVVLGWPLAADVRAALLAVDPVVAPAAPTDETVFAQWADDLAAGAERTDIALLEMQARLRRLVAGAVTPTVASSRPAPRTRSAAHAAAMADFLVRHHAEPIGPADVAAAVHLHPRHAMTVFREVTGDTIGGYLARCRVAQAQRLLLASALPVSAVGHRVGFGSTSRFYSTFTTVVGVPPGRYRRDAAAGGPLSPPVGARPVPVPPPAARAR